MSVKKKGKLILVSFELHSKLQKLCRKEQSYCKLIQEMYDFYMEYKGKPDQIKLLREQNPIWFPGMVNKEIIKK